MKFVNTDYKKHREDVLLERQRGLMPATQPYVELLKHIDSLRVEREELVKREQELNNTKSDEASSLEDMRRNGATVDVMMALRDVIMNFSIQVHECQEKCAAIDYNISLLNGTSKSVQVERRAFVRACPADGCRGFLSTQWKCGLCDARVCKECHEIKKFGNKEDAGEEEHVCKPENVETAKLLAKDSKPCPKCAAMIFKLEGCSQMYCTQCHTAFDWQTLRIETGRIHNPHYYEYLRRTGGNVPREIGDVPCGGVRAWASYQTKLYPILYGQKQAYQNYYYYNRRLEFVDYVNIPIPTNEQLYGAYTVIHRLQGHIEGVELPRFRVTPGLTDYRELRASFMMNKITEDQFKVELQKNEKARDKANDIYMVLQTFQAVCTDLLQRLYLINDAEEATRLYIEFKEIRSYTNSMMMPISKRYHCVVPTISCSWMIQNDAAFPRGKKKVPLAPDAPSTVTAATQATNADGATPHLHPTLNAAGVTRVLLAAAARRANAPATQV